MNTMTMIEKYDAAVAEYMDRLTLQNLTAKTTSNYRKVLSGFGRFLSEGGYTDLYDAVESWKHSLLKCDAKPSTVNQYLTVLKIFFGKATKRSFPADLRFSENPVDEVENVKVVKRPYEEILTDEQVMQLYVNTPPTYHYAHRWARNYAIMMILVNEKIRNAELLDLRLSDVDFENHEIVIENGKGRKYRVVDMCETTETAIMLYLRSGLRPVDLSPDDYLFGTTSTNDFGGGLDTSAEWHRGSGEWLSTMIERTVFAVTGVHDVRTHDLRHVGSRVCLNAGESVEQLQGELGHANVTTTQIYCNKLLPRRHRESAKGVIAARDAAAEKNRAMLMA